LAISVFDLLKTNKESILRNIKLIAFTFWWLLFNCTSRSDYRCDCVLFSKAIFTQSQQV